MCYARAGMDSIFRSKLNKIIPTSWQ